MLSPLSSRRRHRPATTGRWSSTRCCVSCARASACCAPTIVGCRRCSGVVQQTCASRRDATRPAATWCGGAWRATPTTCCRACWSVSAGRGAPCTGAAPTRCCSPAVSTGRASLLCCWRTAPTRHARPHTNICTLLYCSRCDETIPTWWQCCCTLNGSLWISQVW